MCCITGTLRLLNGNDGNVLTNFNLLSNHGLKLRHFILKFIFVYWRKCFEN